MWTHASQTCSCRENVQEECAGRKYIHANKLASIKITNLFLVFKARCSPWLCSSYFLIPALSPVCLIWSLSYRLSSSSLSSTVSVNSNISFSLSQVNGVNIEGLRHSEVVALIRTGGQEVSLLVVDQETDELFHRLGLTPTSNHDKGQIV